MNFYFQNGPWSSSALNEFSYGPWADIKNFLHLASFTEGFTADAKVSCQVRKAAEQLQRHSVARWTERERVSEITHREILLTQNQLLLWKISQQHILTVPTARSVSSQWLEFSRVKAQSSCTSCCKTKQDQATRCFGPVTVTRRTRILIICPWSPTNSHRIYCNSCW